MIGGHDKEPCAEILSRMYFFIDNELADADSHEIQQHLDDCGPCLREIDIERIVKALIARSCTEHAPVELRQRVMFSIRQLQIDLQPGDRVPWSGPSGSD